MSTRLESFYGFLETATLDEVRGSYEEICQEYKWEKGSLKELKKIRKMLKNTIIEMEGDQDNKGADKP